MKPESHNHCSGQRSLTLALAEMALELNEQAISVSALTAGRKMALDTLAVAVAGVSAPGVREMLDQQNEWGGTGEAGVIGCGDRLPAPEAAFINSTMAHALDYDDVYLPGTLHLMCILWPTAFAMGQRVGATGREVLIAAIAGMEVAGRLGIEIGRRAAGEKHLGFLPSSVVGVFGSAVTAGRLLGLDASRMTNALGLAYAQAAGNRQALFDTTLAKRLQPALAARAGVWAACMARRGVTGPFHALEGDAGLFRLYYNAEPPMAEELTAPSGQFKIEFCSVKKYPSCGAAHPVIEAALELVHDYDFDAAQIEQVELYFGPNGDRLVGRPFVLGDNPQVNAQFSAPYCVALALLRGTNSIERFDDGQICADREVIEFSQRRVRVVREIEPLPQPISLPDWLPVGCGRSKAVRVTLGDGRVVRRDRCLYDVLDPHRVSFDDVAMKWRQCAAYAGLSEEAASRLLEMVRGLEQCENVEDLINLTALAAHGTATAGEKHPEKANECLRVN